MKNIERYPTLLLALTTALVVACGDDGSEADEPSGETSPQCDSPSGYIAFDMTNHENQDKRLLAYTQMLGLMSGAIDDDGDVDQDMMAEAADIYTDEVVSADLQAKVQGRLDEHVSGNPAVGEGLDETVVAWLAYGEQAETTLEATVARQWVDKTLQEFWFLSVHHELLLGERAKWDEAYGYYGSGPTNDEDDRTGLASTATKRDDLNGTNLNEEIFNALIDGACELDMALDDEDADRVDVGDVAALESIIEDIDMNLQKVLAYSAGHEAYEMEELLEAGGDDTDEITIKAAELIPFARPLVRIMIDRGGESKARGEELQELMDAMPVSDPDTLDLDDTAWIDDADPARVLELLEAEYGIDVLG